MATATAKLADRIGVASLWTSSNPTLLAGERGVESDTKRFKIGDGSTAWTSLEYASSGEHGAEDTVASATTCAIGATVSENVSITGTTTITGFGTISAGTKRWGRFTGILTLTHNATSLIIPGGANITTAAGDRFVAVSLGSGNWCVLSYTKANGEAVVGGSGGGGGTVDFSTAYEGFTHFLSATLELGLVAVTSGGSVTTGVGTGIHGAVSISTGTTASVNQHANIWQNGGHISWDAVGEKRVIWRVVTLVLPDATATGWIYIGAHRGNNTVTPAEAVMFRVVDNGNLFCVTRRNGTETTTDLGYRPSTGAKTYEVRCNSGGTEVTFYIDGALVATHTTNIPSSSYRCPVNLQCARTSSTAQAIAAAADWMYVKLGHEATSYI